MAYFSNGTEGMLYNEEYCLKCINWDYNEETGESCPIWDAHLMFEGREVQDLLDFLIPRHTFNEKHECCFNECRGFKDASQLDTISASIERSFELESGETGIARVSK